jgi:hypothetical protein
VTTGSPYTLSYVPYFGHLEAGVPFQIQPSLKITDRGGNTITDLNSGTVTASLIRQPVANGQAELLPVSNLEVPFVSGVAQFDGLYLMTAGSPYQIAFQTNLVFCSFCFSLCWPHFSLDLERHQRRVLFKFHSFHRASHTSQFRWCLPILSHPGRRVPLASSSS